MFKDRVPANSDPNELMEFVMARIRSSPLKLVDLKPDKPKSLGPYDCIALHLTLEGTYIQVHGPAEVGSSRAAAAPVSR